MHKHLKIGTSFLHSVVTLMLSERECQSELVMCSTATGIETEMWCMHNAKQPRLPKL